MTGNCVPLFDLDWFYDVLMKEVPVRRDPSSGDHCQLDNLDLDTKEGQARFKEKPCGLVGAYYGNVISRHAVYGFTNGEFCDRQACVGGVVMVLCTV